MVFNFLKGSRIGHAAGAHRNMAKRVMQKRAGELQTVVVVCV